MSFAITLSTGGSQIDPYYDFEADMKATALTSVKEELPDAPTDAPTDVRAAKLEWAESVRAAKDEALEKISRDKGADHKSPGWMKLMQST